MTKRVRQAVGVALFVSGVLLPVFVRYTSSSEDAAYAIPFGVIFALIGGTLWFGPRFNR